ncbi:helix-turn-helix domain-containing protein [Castellaniella hirudinis]|uniref:helix-turn-helix domain-containing protein n=1 Tax=Castellaniella hirudinis TaxID=1144617 RepID=UPI0039C0A51A
MSTPTTIASALKVLAVWEALKGHTLTGLSNTEIAAATGQSAPNVSRALATLAEGGYVTRYESGRYAHSVKTLQIAQAHANHMHQFRARAAELDQRIAAGAN